MANIEEISKYSSKRAKESQIALDEEAVKARQMGMTYGQYQAWKYTQNNRIIRTNNEIVKI